MSKHSWQLHVSAVVVSERIWSMEPFRGIYAYIQLPNLKEIPLWPMANQEPTVATDEALQFYCVWLCLWSNYTSRSEMARFQTRKHSHLLTIATILCIFEQNSHSNHYGGKTKNAIIKIYTYMLCWQVDQVWWDLGKYIQKI